MQITFLWYKSDSLFKLCASSYKTTHDISHCCRHVSLVVYENYTRAGAIHSQYILPLMKRLIMSLVRIYATCCSFTYHSSSFRRVISVHFFSSAQTMFSVFMLLFVLLPYFHAICIDLLKIYFVVPEILSWLRQAKRCLRACAKCTHSDSSHACAKSHPGI